MPRLPNFFIVGAPKAGTTSLYNYLAQHPQVYMSAIKEPHYFADEIASLARDSAPTPAKPFGGLVADWDDYTRLFENAANESALGEASVCYLWSPTAPARIAEKIPGAKILIMLRNPVDRAFSQYLHGLGNGAISWSFREHIQRNQSYNSSQFCVHYPFLEFGLYSEQVTRYRERFGQNVWIGFHEDFKNHPTEVFRNICQFLDVSPDFTPDMARQHLEAQVPRTAAVGWLKRSGIWETVANVTPTGLRPFIRRTLTRKPGATRMDPADRAYLLDFYREDVSRLATLLGRDLDGWQR